MSKFLFICIIGLSLVCSHTVSGQRDMGNIDDVYGLNSELYNGRIYSDFYGSSVKGHPFLLNPEYAVGSIKINNKSYLEQSINYDVFKQKVLLSFTNHTQIQQIIEFPLPNIQSFSFSDKDFQLMKMPDSSLRIFQVIGKDMYPILVYWTKSINTASSTSIYDYQFTNTKRSLWFVKNHHFYSIKKNKSLIKLFGKDQSIGLKKWLKRENIRIQKASDQQLQQVSEYLNAL